MGLWRDRSGSEPTSARSPLRLRAALATFALLIGVLGAAGSWWVLDPGSGIVSAGFTVVALTAAVNLAFILRRL